MSTISDENILLLFRKYEKQVLENFVNHCDNVKYKRNEKELDEEGIWDELLSGMCEEEFFNGILENMERSVSVEYYGFDYIEE